MRQLIADSLLRILSQEEQYSNCNMLLSEAKLQVDTGGTLIDHPNRLGSDMLHYLNIYRDINVRSNLVI